MKPWPIITEDDEVQIVLPEFHDTYFGDTDTMTPEEWHIVHMISATPMLLEACKLAQYAIEACWLRGATGNAELCQTLKGIDKDRFEEAREQLRATIAQAEEAQ